MWLVTGQMAPDAVRALFLWNVGRCLPSDTVSCPRRREFTSVPWSTQCSLPEDLNLHHRYCESLGSHISKTVVVFKEYYSAFVHCEFFRSYIVRCCIRNFELIAWMFHSDWFLLFELVVFISFFIACYVTLPLQLHCYCSQLNLKIVNGKCSVTFPCWQCNSSQLNLCYVCFQWR